MTLPEFASQMIDMIKNLAPQVWAIYLRQNFLSAYLDIIFGVIFLAIVIVLWKKALPYVMENWDDFSVGLVLFLMGFFLILFVVDICYGVSRLYNPEYYVIQDLFTTMKTNFK